MSFWSVVVLAVSFNRPQNLPTMTYKTVTSKRTKTKKNTKNRLGVIGCPLGCNKRRVTDSDGMGGNATRWEEK